MNIGLIGAENSHSRHFCNAINKGGQWPDVRISHLYGADDENEAKKLSEDFGLILCASEEEVIEKSDAIVVTYRRGSMHYEPVMKAIKAGKPVFNDKPFASNAKEAKEICDLATERDVLITGGSNLKGLPELATIKGMIKEGSIVVISFAGDPESVYDGYSFYGIHLTEICMILCGEDYSFVSAFNNKGTLVTDVVYDDKRCFLVSSPQSHDLIISVDGVSMKIPLNYQDIGPAEFINMIKDNKSPRNYSHYVRAVELIDKIKESAKL